MFALISEANHYSPFNNRRPPPLPVPLKNTKMILQSKIWFHKVTINEFKLLWLKWMVIGVRFSSITKKFEIFHADNCISFLQDWPHLRQKSTAEILTAVEKDDNLLIASHLTTFPLSIHELTSTFSLCAWEKKEKL